MAGQMCWKPPGHDAPLLHLRSTPQDRWMPYRLHPAGLPDKGMMTPGFNTFCVLLEQGWESVPAWDVYHPK
jgi:hypothetical protein